MAIETSPDISGNPEVLGRRGMRESSGIPFAKDESK
jgi:hypothetical protein